MDDWNCIYVENDEGENSTLPAPYTKPAFALYPQDETDPISDLTKKQGADWEPYATLPYVSHIH